jgi:hypothetical protein
MAISNNERYKAIQESLKQIQTQMNWLVEIKNNLEEKDKVAQRIHNRKKLKRRHPHPRKKHYQKMSIPK